MRLLPASVAPVVEHENVCTVSMLSDLLLYDDVVCIPVLSHCFVHIYNGFKVSIPWCSLKHYLLGTVN